MFRLCCVSNFAIINFSNNLIRQCQKVLIAEQILTKSTYNCKTIYSKQFLSTLTAHRNDIQDNEKEFLVKLKNDPDTFGETLEDEIQDEGDLKEEEYLQNPPSQRLSTKQYADIIKSFIQKRKIKEAIDVLEVKMLKEDKVKPENYIYNLLLGACGRVGYTKKAFSLYNQMKKRGLRATGGTYTALFNACANSPWKDDGLTRATHLRNIMLEKHDEPNDTNYNAMIKAFGVCGDLKTAFSICDEMVSKGFVLKDDTLNFLLQACISDKEAGFRHALLVWRKFINKKIPPTIYSYNLMLRCVRDCGLGDTEITNDVINQILLTSPTKGQNLQLQPGTKVPIQNDQPVESSIAIKNSIEDIVENRPNLMARVPYLGNILSITEIKTPQDRLLLIGGYSNFLSDMKNNDVTPDIKTFTQLLNCVPNTLTIEEDLLETMQHFQIKPDLDFYNMLIKKRSMRFDYVGAKQVVDELKKFKYRPDLITYGVLALGCTNKEEAESLIQEMKFAKYRLNTEILGTMINNACFHKNFEYVIYIMQICIEEEVRPNPQFMQTLKNFKKQCKFYSNNKENPIGKSKSFNKKFEIFKMEYHSFLNKADPIIENETHPWQQFREEIKTDTKYYKPDTDGMFKARHISLFRQKKHEVKAKIVKKRNVKNT